MSDYPNSVNIKVGLGTLLGVQVNSICFAAAGSTVELGYYYKPSDDEFCDDEVLGSTTIQIPNESLVPFLDAFIESSKAAVIAAAVKDIEATRRAG